MINLVFAFLFMVLGAAISQGANTEVPASAGAFATLVINLFTAQLGDWSFFVIGLVAFVTMFSTLLTALDGQVRIFDRLLATTFPQRYAEATPQTKQRVFNVSVFVYACGGATIVGLFMQSFGTFINFVTSLGFLLAPLIAFLNHRAMFNTDVPPTIQPSRLYWWWSVIGGIALTTTALVFFFY